MIRVSNLHGSMNTTYQLVFADSEDFCVCIIDLIKTENYSCGKLPDMKYFVKDAVMIIIPPSSSI